MTIEKKQWKRSIFNHTQSSPNVEAALEINASICFDSCVTFQRRIMHTTEEADARFYRDTESIAFPALSDEQLATLESLGTRRKVNRGEIVYKAGQRDVPFNLVLSGELEVFESRDGEEQILGVPGPRDFVGDISMLTGTAVIATVRGKAEESEIVQIPAARFRRALAEIPSVSETIVSALIMRRKRLQRDREFTGFVIRGRGINSTIFSIRTIIHTESSTQRANKDKRSRNG